MKELKGIITAMVTPFDEHEKLDIDAAEKMADWLIDMGINGLFIAGTNGEFNVMDDDEIVQLTAAIHEVVADRVPLITGGGKNGTLQTIRLVNQLQKAGADYVSIVTPYYQKITQQETINHYKTIARATSAQLILYNIPSLTGNPIDPESLATLTEVDNIVAIKDSGGDFEIQKKYIEVTKNTHVNVLNGSDSKMLVAFQAGSVGSVAATSNVIPKIEVDLYQYFLGNDLVKAQKKRDEMDMLRMILKKCPAPAVMKYTLNQMGIKAGIPRRPILELDETVKSNVDKMIQYYNRVN
ncbi:MAG: dihydrodipicolinate synthase family protein [Sporolactobacillus sp.]|jgi:4-hydroxy-tetrahydrodipicolinate synthase|nr:dihydrodipicolinate synthase family protein [Sporolactobacillus sp.]